MNEHDEERILGKIDQMEGYLREIERVLPDEFEEYKKIEKRRSTERLLQLAIETVIDISNLMVSGLDLGLPSEENDLFDKLEEEKIIAREMKKILYEMRGFHNILVHEYANGSDRLVYQMAKENQQDFREFSRQIKKQLKDLV